MKGKIIGIFVCMLLIATVLPATGIVNESDLVTYLGVRQERDFGDAPEGDNAIAYPSLGVLGSFPTCKTTGPSGWVQHDNYGGYFGPGVDFESDGNGGLCPGGFPPYDQDECFQDGDAGLIIPEPFTIDSALNVVPCPAGNGTALGFVGQTAVWGTDIDIHVHNTMPNHPPYVIGYVNLLIDWNQNGVWGDPGEHVLVNFVVPALYVGLLSALGPPSFTIGSNPGYVWVRFSITESPVPQDWDGEGDFEDGESEDYLFLIDEETQPKPNLDCKGSITWTRTASRQPGGTRTGTFQVGNIGDPGSLLNWQVTSWPAWGTWTFSPSSGTGLAAGSWTTVTATCVAPNQPNQEFTGEIEVCNTDDPTDCCKIPVTLKTPRARQVNPLFVILLEIFIEQFPMLNWILNFQ
jgi:hypothetical protein